MGLILGDALSGDEAGPPPAHPAGPSLGRLARSTPALAPEPPSPPAPEPVSASAPEPASVPTPEDPVGSTPGRPARCTPTLAPEPPSAPEPASARAPESASIPGPESASIPGPESASAPGPESASIPGPESASVSAPLLGSGAPSEPTSGTTLSTASLEGFEGLFRGQVGRLVRLAHLLGAEDAEDVVQEAFCRLYAVRRHREIANLPGYLNRMVVNEVRSRRRRKLIADRKILHPATAAPADEQVELAESVLGLMRALDRLAPRQREALVLRYWLDLPLADIADAMQVRVGTVKSLVSRGLARLAVELEDHR